MGAIRFSIADWRRLDTGATASRRYANRTRSTLRKNKKTAAMGVESLGIPHARAASDPSLSILSSRAVHSVSDLGSAGAPHRTGPPPHAPASGSRRMRTNGRGSPNALRPSPRVAFRCTCRSVLSGQTGRRRCPLQGTRRLITCPNMYMYMSVAQSHHWGHTGRHTYPRTRIHHGIHAHAPHFHATARYVLIDAARPSSHSHLWRGCSPSEPAETIESHMPVGGVGQHTYFPTVSRRASTPILSHQTQPAHASCT